MVSQQQHNALMNIFASFLLFVCLLLSETAFAQTPFKTQSPETAKGDRLFSRELYKEALAEYHKLSLSSEVEKRMGAAYIKLWDMPAAIEALRGALKQAPDDSEAKVLLAEALSWNKNFGEAAAMYKDLLASGYSGVDARLGYARTLSWMKNFDAAIVQYKAAAQEYPSNLDAHMGLGQLLSWQKQFDNSLAAYRRVVTLTSVPEYKSAALARIGQVHVWKGDMDAARTAWGEAVRFDAGNVDALLGLGELDEWSGNYKEAKRRYERILKVQPEHKAAKSKLLQLLWVK
jgi:tetratricopeptide (TPR) repeat protein